MVKCIRMIAAHILILCVLITGLNIKASDKEEGPFHYCNINCNGIQHTMCKYPAGGGKNCPDKLHLYLNKEERRFALENINGLRLKIARGERDRFPPASNMMKLVWDAELAMIAKRWADQCEETGHDECRITEKGEEVGQAVYVGTAKKHEPRDEFEETAEKIARIKEALNGWIRQEKLLDPAWIRVFNSKEEESVGEFTQIIWATTEFVGCSYSEFGWQENTTWRFVCNFKRQGNIPKGEVYREGKPCSDCPEKSVCSVTFVGLCYNGLIGDFVEENAAGHKRPAVLLLISFLCISYTINMSSEK